MRDDITGVGGRAMLAEAVGATLAAPLATATGTKTRVIATEESFATPAIAATNRRIRP